MGRIEKFLIEEREPELAAYYNVPTPTLFFLAEVEMARHGWKVKRDRNYTFEKPQKVK